MRNHALPITLSVLLAMVMSAGAQEAGDAGNTDERAGRLEAPGEASPMSPSIQNVDPDRFGDLPDAAYGAFQRGYYITAHNLALPRAQNGDPAAQTLIAEIYARGLGVPRDAKKAASWYTKAADKGVPEAQFQLALMLIDGDFVEKDEQRAFALMKTAADSGNRLAQFNLAQMILEKDSSLEGQEEAIAYYERAAKARLADAEYAMAQIRANGFGGKPTDEAEARRWLLRAAKQNFDTAQLDLGTWLVEGRGGKPDAKAGFAWLKLAAESGNVAAQNRLAKLYRSGVGTEANVTDAAAWYISARRAGLIDRQMEDFLAGLTAEEMKEAIQRANRLR